MSASPIRSRVVPILVWLGALAILLAPVLAALGLTGLATLGGCAVAQAAPCRVAGFDIGLSLKSTLDMAWSVPVAIGGLWPLALALVATLAAHRAFDGFGARFLFGGLVVAIALLATILAPMAFVFGIAPETCEINEGGVGDCVLYGVEQGMSTHSAAVAPWLLFILGPAALAYLVIHLVILSIMAVMRARRA